MKEVLNGGYNVHPVPPPNSLHDRKDILFKFKLLSPRFLIKIRVRNMPKDGEHKKYFEAVKKLENEMITVINSP